MRVETEKIARELNAAMGRQNVSLQQLSILEHTDDAMRRQNVSLQQLSILEHADDSLKNLESSN